jgi:hypothetical protein
MLIVNGKTGQFGPVSTKLWKTAKRGRARDLSVKLLTKATFCKKRLSEKS